jgi:hypothetical protein
MSLSQIGGYFVNEIKIAQEQESGFRRGDLVIWDNSGTMPAGRLRPAGDGDCGKLSGAPAHQRFGFPVIVEMVFDSLSVPASS